MLISIFMDSKINNTSPASTCCPGFTQVCQRLPDTELSTRRASSGDVLVAAFADYFFGFVIINYGQSTMALN